MRHISFNAQKPDDAWIARAEALLVELKAAPDEKAIHKIIDDNSDVWGDLKDWLLSLSNQKCWFSEAKDCFSHWDVEHYRPKKSAKDLDGTKHGGYWWLTFCWKNLRICGNVGNRKKGTFFPLRDGCPRCPPHGDLRHEDPMLLDPADEDDPVLLSFNVLGDPIVASHVSDPWEKQRVEYSIDRLKLKFDAVVQKRKVLWSECADRVNEYLDELKLYHADKTNAVAKQGSKKAANRVRELIKPDKELSAVARACVESFGDPRVSSLLRTN